MISMTQMAEMMQKIQSMLAEMKPQLVTSTKKIKEIKQNQQQQISLLNKMIDSIEKSQGFLGEKYENLLKRTDGLIKENETIKKRNQDQHAQIKVIKQKLKYEKNARNDSDQYMRRGMVEINGFPQKKDENLTDLVIKLATDMKVPISNGHVEVVHRLSTREKAGIKFSLRPLAERFLANKRSLHTKSARDYYYVLENQEDKEWIFINESLTKMNKELFKKACKQCEDKNFQFVWTKNGNILVRKDGESSIIKPSFHMIVDDRYDHWDHFDR